MHVSYSVACLASILHVVWHHNIASSLSTTICCVSSDSFKSSICFDVYSVLPWLLMQLLLNFNYHLLAVSCSLGRFTTICGVACHRLSNFLSEVFSVLDAHQSFGYVCPHFLALVLQQIDVVRGCALLLSVTVIDCLHCTVLRAQVFGCQH